MLSAPMSSIFNRSAGVLKPALFAALLAAGSAQADVTGIEIYGLSPDSSDCSYMRLDYRIEGSGEICHKITIEHGGNTGVADMYSYQGSFKDAPYTNGMALYMPNFDGLKPYEMPTNEPFELTVSAGLSSTYPSCDTVDEKVRVDSCATGNFNIVYKVEGIASAGGNVNCVPDAGNFICRAVPGLGFTYVAGSMKLVGGSGAVISDCDDVQGTCKVSNVTGDVEVQAAFTAQQPQPAAGGPAAVSTLGEAGLLLSGLALAGAAAPALRRRRKPGEKA